MSKNILIVGASGLVGGEILKNLKTTNNELILLSRKTVSYTHLRAHETR